MVCDSNWHIAKWFRTSIREVSFRTGRRREVQEPVQGYRVSFVACMLFTVACAPMCHGADPASALSGVVRDVQGVPQMGAVIELIGAGQGSARTAITGLDGRFLFDHLVTGTYQLHASSSLLRPTSTRGIRVTTGVQAVVNLTLANMYEGASWLPAERRHSDESLDDWMWTMRSGASRPVLRLASGPASGTEAASRRATVPLSLALTSQSGGFGSLGPAQEVVTGYRSADGSRIAMTTMQYVAGSTGGQGSPLRMRAGIARQSSPWNRFASTVGYSSDPQVKTVGLPAGRRFVRLASAETIGLGTTVELQAGGALESDQAPRSPFASRPFGRVRLHVARDWSVEYAMATDRSVQRAIDAEIPVEAGSLNRSTSSQQVERVEHGRHDMLAIGQQTRTRHLHIAYYNDRLTRTPVVGLVGVQKAGLVLADPDPLNGALVDHANGTFRAEAAGYRTQGCAVTMSQTWGPNEWIEVSLRSGAALMAQGNGFVVPSADPLHLSVGHGVALGVSSHTRIRRTGTDLRASYQWQPERLVTPIDAFDAFGVPAYLGISLRQGISGHAVPHGTVLSLSAVNLLRQGLRPAILSEQRDEVLAQELPTLQAGIGFSF